jgi:hypothetical protein
LHDTTLEGNILTVGTTTSVPANPFNLGTRTGSGSAASGDFDEQLASALSESLRKLGMAAGEVNITIRRGTESASARQILITYNAATDAAVAETVTTAATTATTPAAGTPSSSPASPADISWSPWHGPGDRRDGVPAGGGQTSASGAPAIQLNAAATQNQYNYAGFGAFNPYFTSPSNPLRPGYVLGFANWFRDASIYGGVNGPVPANRTFFATEEGAQEALRLVRQYEPAATLTQMSWGGGPFTANNSMYYVQLPGDKVVNAGLILSDYYHGGAGVTASSDELLAHALQSA